MNERWQDCPECHGEEGFFENGTWEDCPSCQGEGGWFVSAESLPEPFGVVWERFWKLRRGRGESWLASLVRSWGDAKAVTGAQR